MREKNTTFFIKGMHCASCEVLIEKKLLKEKDILSANASLTDGRVDLSFKGNVPEPKQLNSLFSEQRYFFSKSKFRKQSLPLFRFNNGQLQFNPPKLKQLLLLSSVIVLLLIAFTGLENSGIGSALNVSSSSSLPTFFIFGLLAGASSCAALVGGMLIFGVSIVMLLLGFQMIGFQWAQNFRLKLPKSISRYTSNEGNFKGKYMPFVSGALTFIVPCGFTLVAQGIALTSGSFTQGLLIMLTFSLGTLPMLALISLSSVKFARRPHLNFYFTKVAAILVLFFALYNINGQLNLMGLPSLSDLKLYNSEPVFAAANPIVNGVQRLEFTAKGFKYTSNSGTTLTAGVKTILEFDNQGISGCGAYVSARGLFAEVLKLEPGKNTVEFTPVKGTYKITCTMGMVPPVTINVI
jgi:sulfite exporter TauE/SafE/copper chaperone CopZ